MSNCMPFNVNPKPHNQIISYILKQTWCLSVCVDKNWAVQGQTGQDRAARQKDLGNFRIWFSGHGFQDLGSQLWGLDFHTRGFQDRNLKTFKTWFSGCGISILGPGFHTGGFTVAFGHRHPLVYIYCLSWFLFCEKIHPTLKNVLVFSITYHSLNFFGVWFFEKIQPILQK